MFRTFSTSFLAFIAVVGLFDDTAVGGLLPAESMVDGGGSGMGCSKSNVRGHCDDASPVIPASDQRMGSNDFTGSGMQTSPSSPSSAPTPFTLTDSPELGLVPVMTYIIRESRAFVIVPFLDGIFRPPKMA